MAAAKIYFEKQNLVGDIKQSSQAYKALGPAHRQIVYGPACFVSFPPLVLATPSGYCSNLYTLSNVLFLLKI
jgi:hypothetical protein